MTRTAGILSLSLLLISLFAAGSSIAQTTESSDSLARLAAAVENLTRQLEQQDREKDQDRELRKLDIAISYLNFRSRRIETMERDLGIIKNERARIEDALKHWQSRRDMLTNDLEGATGDEKQNLQREIQEMIAREKSFEQRLGRYEEDIIIHENRISELQADLDSVESYVQQNLKM